MEKGDEAILKQGIVDFIKISYYSSRVVSEESMLGAADNIAVVEKIYIWRPPNGTGRLI